MVLADDNFSTIVEAIKYGRNIFDNIKKSVHFLIATNIAEIATIFLGLLLGLKNPLTAIQLLWINLVTDSLPAIALGLEPAEENIMKKRPRNPRKSLFADGLWNKIALEGIMIGVLNLFTFYIGYRNYGLEVARTMAFVSLGLLELVHIFNVRTDKPIFKSNFFSNKYLIGAFIVGIALQVVVVIVPFFAQIFEVTMLNGRQWLFIIFISLMSIVLMEVQKMLDGYKFEKINSEITIKNIENGGIL